MSSPASSRSLSELPDCIVGDILSRVPAETIYVCRCVCKTWLDLISDPFFSTLHANNLRPSTVMLLTLRKSWKLSFLDIDEIYRHRRRIRCNERVLSHPRCLADSVVLGSCNGLFLMRHKFSRTLLIYNPNLNEYEYFDTCDDSEILGMGVGYNATQDEYKIVKFIYTASSDVTVAKLCVLGKNKKTSWKNIIDKIPFEGKPSFMSHCGVWHDGRGEICWFIVHPFGLGFICCFNVDSEQFRVISDIPLRLKREISVYRNYNVRLGVLRGRLNLSHGSSYGICHFRFTEDCGWRNQFLVLKYRSGGSFHLLDEWPSGEILFMDDDGELFVNRNWWTTKLDQEETLDDGPIQESYAYVPSLISPKMLLGNVRAEPVPTTVAPMKTKIPRLLRNLVSVTLLPWDFWLGRLVPILRILHVKSETVL